jgi:microcystin-dependent protein
MAQPYVGEIRMFAGNFAPAGWAFCDGQMMPISEYETLFNLIGTTYGGDGESTFALPNLQSRLPIHQGNGFTMAETGGAEVITLATSQMPIHRHAPAADSRSGTSADPVGHVWANSAGAVAYSSDTTGPAMAAEAVKPAGGTRPHSNVQPYLCVSFIISLFGIYPSQT